MTAKEVEQLCPGVLLQKDVMNLIVVSKEKNWITLFRRSKGSRWVEYAEFNTSIYSEYYWSDVKRIA